MRGSLILAGITCAALALLPLSSKAQEVTAIRAGRIMTMAGPPIDNGVIICKNGKIIAIGPSSKVKVPAGATVIDARADVVMPGLVAAYSTLAGSGESPESISPDIRAIDGYDFFSDNNAVLRGGLTTAYLATSSRRLVSGQGAVVKTAGETPASRTLAAGADVRAALGAGPKDPPAIFRPAIPPTTTNPLLPAQRQLASVRPAEFAMLRQLIADARWDATHRGAMVHVVGVGASDAGLHMAERRMKLLPLAPVISGRLPLRITANTVADIRSALHFASEEKIAIVLEGAAEGGQIAAEIAARNVAVVASSPVEPGRPVMVDFARGTANGTPSLDNLSRLARAGVKIAIQPSTDSQLTDLLGLAAAQTAYGLSADAALRSVTSTAAQILGVDGKVGSLTIGKDADLLVLSGYPLATSTHVLRTVIGGRTVYSEIGSGGAVTTAIKAGRIYTVSHGVIENGVLLLNGSTITGINTNGIVPEGARVIDASHSSVIPGMIDCYSYLGLHSDSLTPGLEPDAPASGAATARMRLTMALRANDASLAQTLDSGVTSVLLAPQASGAVSGTASLIKPLPAPDGLDAGKERLVRETAAICFNMQGGAPRMAQPWMVEDLLTNAKAYNARRLQYLRDEKQWEHDAAEAKKLKKDPPTEPAEVTADEDLDPFVDLFRGEIPAFVHVNRADEIANALKVFRDENGLSLTLIGAADAYHTPEEIRKRDVSVAIGPENTRMQHGVLVNLPRELSQAGIHVILESSSESGTQLLRLNAIDAVRNGMDPVEALRSITLGPAVALHVERRLGSIDSGKDADLVILDGDPLEFATRVQKVLVNGKVVYDGHVK